MKSLFLFLLAISLFSSCSEKKKVLSEDFVAIGFDGRGHQIKVNDSMFFEVPKLKCIVFLYHDSVFKVEIDNENKEHYNLLKAKEEAKDTLISKVDLYRKTTLKSQLKEIEEHGTPHGCFSNGYFLFRTNEKLQFGLFDFMKYYDWRGDYRIKETPLNEKQFPKIYQTVYHTFHSKWWDYYMSNEYHFKDLRLHYSKVP